MVTTPAAAGAHGQRQRQRQRQLQLQVPTDNGDNTSCSCRCPWTTATATAGPRCRRGRRGNTSTTRRTRRTRGWGAQGEPPIFFIFKLPNYPYRRKTHGEGGYPFPCRSHFDATRRGIPPPCRDNMRRRGTSPSLSCCFPIDVTRRGHAPPRHVLPISI